MATSHFRRPVMPAAPADSETWEPIRAELERSVPDFKFHIWIEPLELVGRERGVLYVRAADHIRTWVRDRYSHLIAEVASRVLGEPLRIQLVDPQWSPPRSGAA